MYVSVCECECASECVSERECVCASVRVCATFSVNRCNNNSLYLQRVRRRVQAKKEKDLIRLKKVTGFKKYENGKAGTLFIGRRSISLAGVLTWSVSIV